MDIQDEASDYEPGNSRFESWWDRVTFDVVIAKGRQMQSLNDRSSLFSETRKGKRKIKKGMKICRLALAKFTVRSIFTFGNVLVRRSKQTIIQS